MGEWCRISSPPVGKLDKNIIMNSPLVTIIIPCYNMGGKIHRLLDSILVQTYTHLHVVVVDDGSTDNSKQVVHAYNERMAGRGIDYEYVYKPNGGLGSAINKGLKYIKGEYFCWPDADDTLEPESIEKRVEFLENNQDYGLVRSDANIYNESDLTQKVGCITNKAPSRFKETNLFEDYILAKNVIFCPGCHMIRTSAFKKINPEMEIFEGQNGQNYQMLLPMIYHYKFGFIDECLYNYVIYKGSMSHRVDLLERSFAWHQEIILQTLKRISMSDQERKYYENLTEQKYIVLKCLLALGNGNKKIFKNLYKSIDKDYIPLFSTTSVDQLRLGHICSYIPGVFTFFSYLLKTAKRRRQ